MEFDLILMTMKQKNCTRAWGLFKGLTNNLRCNVKLPKSHSEILRKDILTSVALYLSLRKKKSQNTWFVKERSSKVIAGASSEFLLIIYLFIWLPLPPLLQVLPSFLTPPPPPFPFSLEKGRPPWGWMEGGNWVGEGLGGEWERSSAGRTEREIIGRENQNGGV